MANVKESTMASLYSLKNVLDKNPIQLSGAAMAVLNVPIVSGTIDWSTATVAAANVALVAVLGLFISAKTSNDAVLQELADGTEWYDYEEVVQPEEVVPAEEIVVNEEPGGGA